MVLPSLVTKQNKLVLTQQVHEYMQLVGIYDKMQYFLQVIAFELTIGRTLKEFLIEENFC